MSLVLPRRCLINGFIVCSLLVDFFCVRVLLTRVVIVSSVTVCVLCHYMSFARLFAAEGTQNDSTGSPRKKLSSLQKHPVSPETVSEEKTASSSQGSRIASQILVAVAA